jgi:hypothetical protein
MEPPARLLTSPKSRHRAYDVNGLDFCWGAVVALRAPDPTRRVRGIN